MEGEEEFQIVEQVQSAETLPVIEVEELNPEGYGIDDFQPTAVFEENKDLDAIPPTDADTEETSKPEDQAPDTEQAVAEAVTEAVAEPGETPDAEESAKVVEDVNEGRVSILQRKSKEKRRDSEMGPISKESLLMDQFALICKPIRVKAATTRPI
uniref:Uncharacterized protein n=1 Tax=Photinus pyralis TaxID=7054 RepID=A0A1Y1MXX8_PHOPY